MALMRKTLPPDNLILEDYYRAKKIVSKLGLTAKKIDCYANGCMLFYTKEWKALQECKFCGITQYSLKKVGKGKYKEVYVKRMHYFPLISKLKRLYTLMSYAPHMRWHYENRHEYRVFCHLPDGETWKHFDLTYPDFAIEPQNVRLGLCADGFTPYSQSALLYFCWPIIATPYNLPPKLCMTTPYMFLTLIIPGPHNPKGKIDEYLEPLWDELKFL